jgi:hypothetical protein
VARGFFSKLLEGLSAVCFKWFESESATFCWIDSMLRNYWRYTQAWELSIGPAVQNACNGG